MEVFRYEQFGQVECFSILFAVWTGLKMLGYNLACSLCGNDNENVCLVNLLSTYMCVVSVEGIITNMTCVMLLQKI